MVLFLAAASLKWRGNNTKYSSNEVGVISGCGLTESDIPNVGSS